MITVNALTRVLQIKFNNALGSSFTVEDNGIQYLVSAKHVFKGIADKSIIYLQVFNDNQWKNLNAQLYFHENNSIDIAVLKYLNNTQITPTLPITTTTNGLLYGEDVYILGYPLGLRTTEHNLGTGNPIPLIKKGVVSTIKNENGIEFLLLDVMNNKGFSGGVALTDREDKMNFLGVISGYQPYQTPVYEPTDDPNNPRETKYFIKENTGIALIYSIKHVFEVIEKIKNDNN
ncbi:MAG: trypsin-like peptidase domain-containing protein [Tenericutes bacterium]|nr:trypsin-like peptidase domain-containing protein [Mycoplasmatota bacterium]